MPTARPYSKSMARRDTVRAVLDRARFIIERNSHCQGADARTVEGRKVWPSDRDAVSWCMTGALLLAARSEEGDIFLPALKALARAVGVQRPEDVRQSCEAIWGWEDEPGRQKQEVLDCFGRAISSVKT